MMIPSKETYVHDAELEIVVPNGIIEFNEENIDNIINAQERTQIFHDELLCAYLITTLPPESNLETKEEATEFFKKLEVKLQATLVDTPNLSNLAVPPNYYTSELSRSSSSSSTSSSISGIFSSGTSLRSASTNATSPPTPGSPTSGYSFKKLTASKVIEGTVIHSAQYDSKKNNNNKMVVVERDDCWTCVLPLSFPIENIKTRAQNQIALDVTVTQSRKMKSPDSDLYSLENFGMNLLGGLNDDPAFGLLNFSIPIPRSENSLKKTGSIYSTSSSKPIKRFSRKIFSLKPTLNARVRPTYVSPSENTIMMSVELENETEDNIEFSIEDLKVEVAHGFVTRHAWGPQDISNEKFPIMLRPFDQVNFLYNVTILEDHSFPEPLNTQQYYPTPSPHSKTSSRRDSIASIASTLNMPTVEDKHRNLSIIVRGCPIIDGVKSRCIESKWNCELDISTLFNDSMASLQLRHALAMGNNKFNYGMERGINTATKIRDPFSNVKNGSLHNTKRVNNLSDVGLEINVNGVNIANKQQQSGYIPDINLLNFNGGDNGILPNGRSPKAQKQANLDLNACDGVFVSFEVGGKPVVGKVFTMKVTIVNKSKHVRRFTILVPNKKRSNEKLFSNHQLSTKTFLSQYTDITLVESNHNEYARQTLRNPFMDETVFLRKHLEHESSGSDLICLDNGVRVCPLNPYDSETVTLRFISTKEELHLVELVQLVDDDTGFITNFRNVVQFNVTKNEKRMKRMERIDHNSFALNRHIEVTG